MDAFRLIFSRIREKKLFFGVKKRGEIDKDEVDSKTW